MNLILASGEESTTSQASVPEKEPFIEVSFFPKWRFIIKSDEFNFNYNNTGLRSIAGYGQLQSSKPVAGSC